MPKRILLLGRKGIIVEDAKSRLNDPDLEIFGGTSIEDVRSTFAQTEIDHVFMGAGIELEKRLEIIAEIFGLSNTTSIHLKDSTSGPKGFLPFVHAILTGLKTQDV